MKRPRQPSDSSEVASEQLQNVSTSPSTVSESKEEQPRDDSVNTKDTTGVTKNISSLSPLFECIHEADLTIDLGDRESQVKSVSEEILAAMQEEASIPKDAKEVTLVQPAVKKILTAGLKKSGAFEAGLFLASEVVLPKVHRTSDRHKTPLTPYVRFPLTRTADCALCFSSAEFDHSQPEKSFGADPSHRDFLLCILTIEIKRFLKLIADWIATEKLEHSDGVIQASSYILYCMLRVLPHLSDAEKVELFGNDLSMYTLLSTHMFCILIQVSLSGFHLEGRFSVKWSNVRSEENMATTIARYILWAKDFLKTALRFKDALANEPKYTWMPLSEYALKFSDEIPDAAVVATSYQSLTNPVLRTLNGRVYRLYKHYLCNTKDSSVELLFKELERIRSDARAELEKEQYNNLEKDLQIATLQKNILIWKNASEKELEDADKQLEVIKEKLLACQIGMDLDDPQLISQLIPQPIPQPLDPHPLTGWKFKAPFLSMPFYGPTLDDAMKTTLATPKHVKALLQSLLKSSLLPLQQAKFAHMDLRAKNICLKESKATWNDAILIDFDYCVDYSKITTNPMDNSIPQYPPERTIHPNSDVWMVGYLLLELGVCGEGWEKLELQVGIEKWDVLRETRRSGEFAEAWDLAAKCLKVNPEERVSFTEMKEIVDGWKV
ncbi:hypothetical protein BDR26DRAFT_867782 [Obelidium mucronatum]|nr:hypothetical protein BDR26DRAFT_867782 [Obelidium mucronatum]